MRLRALSASSYICSSYITDEDSEAERTSLNLKKNTNCVINFEDEFEL